MSYSFTYEKTILRMLEPRTNLLVSVFSAIFGGSYKALDSMVILQAHPIRFDIALSVCFYAVISAIAGLTVKMGIEHTYKYFRHKINQHRELKNENR